MNIILYYIQTIILWSKNFIDKLAFFLLANLLCEKCQIKMQTFSIK